MGIIRLDRQFHVVETENKVALHVTEDIAEARETLWDLIDAGNPYGECRIRTVTHEVPRVS